MIWKEEQKQAFDTLKKALTTEPVLQGPNFTKQFTVQTDASDVGIGGVLSQKDEAQEDRPVAFFSRKLLSREKNYATVEKECLAIVETIKHFSVYLTGVPFTVVTDHSCLRYLNQMSLAIVETIKHFSVYLTGVPFTVVTDHSCLRYLNQMRDTGGGGGGGGGED